MEILSNDNQVVRVRILGGDEKEISIGQAYYPHKAGAKRKARVVSLDKAGNIAKVRLS